MIAQPPPPSRPASEPSLFPERVGRYEILLPIASGGMATVYLARMQGPHGFEREVALKLVHAHLREDPFFSRELLDEANLAAKIRHPNVVPVLEAGEDRFGVFLVMEYVEGDTLAGITRRGGPLPPHIAARILTDALAGLHAAHELTDGHGTPLGLVHRDFSPQNVLIGTDGMTRLADFGVAKAASRVGHTATGVMKGKVAYMSPEQAQGQALDRRCDVWAAGVVAWEVVAGRKLYSREDEMVTLWKVMSGSPPRLGQVAAGIAPELEEAVAIALDRRVEARHQTAASFRAALAAAFRSGAGIADTDEVAAYTANLLTPQLTTRRSRVAEVLALRERQRSAAPSPEAPIATPPPALAATLLSPGETSTTVALPAAVVNVDRQDFPAATPPPSVAPRSARRLATAAIALAALGAVAVRWVTLRHQAEPVAAGAPALTPSASPLASSVALPASSATAGASAVAGAASAPSAATLASASASTPASTPTATPTAKPSRGALLPPKRAAQPQCAPVTIDLAGKKHYHAECMNDGT
jgi:serine/threonine-protein kinase